MKKTLIIIFFSLLHVQMLFAQREVEKGVKSFGDRVYFGGNFNLQFGNVTFIDISPLAGYMVTDKLSVGSGITYQYLNYRWLNNYSTNIYGGRVFARHNIFQQFFAHAEAEALNVEYPQLVGVNGNMEWQFVRDWVPGVFVGGGMFQPFGRRGGINLMGLYNLSYIRGKSPYASPFVIRAGFTF